MKKLSSVGELEWYRNKILAQEDEAKTRVLVCMTGCRAYGAAEVRDALAEEVRKQGLSGQVEVRSTGCHGFCAKAPVMAIDPLGVQYQEVNPEDAAEMVALTLKENRFIDRLSYRDPQTGSPVYYRSQIPFYQKQVRRVLASCGRIDPTKIEHYIACRWLSGYCSGSHSDDVRAGHRGSEQSQTEGTGWCRLFDGCEMEICPTSRRNAQIYYL